MKKFFTKTFVCLLSLLVSLVSLTNAQVLLTDDFNYTGNLSANGWTIHGTAANPLVTTTPGLSYAGMPAGVGNAALIPNAAGEDGHRTFATQSTDGQSVYVSALVNVTDAGSARTGDYFLHLGPNPISTAFVGRVAARIVADNVNFGLSVNSTTFTWGATNFAKNTTYLLIMKYTISTAGDETISIWVIGSGVPATEGAAGAALVSVTGPGQNSIGSVALRQGNTSMPQTVVDQLIVGQTWADVTPANVSTPALTVSGAITTLTTPEGTPSAPQSFNVSGANLTGAPGNIAVSSASTDIEISLNSGGPYSGSLNIPYTSAALAATPVYARISADATIGAVSSLITVSGGGAPNATITVSGDVVAPEPTVQATNVSISGITDNGFTINWTNGNGGSRIVVVRQSTTTVVAPVDATTYTANPAVTGASSTGTGNFVVYNASGTGPVVVSNLFAGTNYTIQVYEYDGGPGEENYLTATATGNPVTASTTGIGAQIQQGYFTSVSTPLYAARSAVRVPTVYVAKVTGLAPNTTYRFYGQAVLATDFGTTITGVGSLLLNDYTGTPAFYNASTGSLTTDGQYGKFTTNAAGSFTGAFGFFSSTNTKFDAGNQLYPLLVIGDDIPTSTIKYRFALDQYVTMLNYASTGGANDGSFINGTSGATPNNIVALWKSIDGNLAAARPLAMTIVENSAATTTIPAPYDETDGSWNTIIPNVLPEGVRLIQQFSPLGVLVGCSSDADGVWGTTNTVNPTTGSGTTTVLTIASANAPLTGTAGCNGIIVLPVKISSFNVQKQGSNSKITWTTEQEINSREFVVERSNDQRTWTTVTTVPAAGNSLSRINYSTTDFAPARGINYYRLKAVDIDNRSENSAYRSVLFGGADVVLITPNPASSFATVYMGKADNSVSEIVVTDMNGKQIERVRTADQTHTLTTARYSKGLYIIRVISGTNMSTHKLVIQ